MFKLVKMQVDDTYYFADDRFAAKKRLELKKAGLKAKDETKLTYTTDINSFANNKDLSSQLKYVIILRNETRTTEETFKVISNVVHYSFTKIVATDSYSFYKCLIKLGTIKEKKLIIDIIALRQSYERKEIAEIR
ncbi:hypothetical protein MBM_06902 [Drepanopeziza brunnea f. sp. 'multigermtubi' MB_m1]|uniref:Uncharacterized protein n=1 Tax=Marssonina brunnea f. sp. multigermtubi (strain MB_m1) TaxID=1072389 RepID=K1WQB3_MARBU|nr:uncharacterized protein MBM_06902 [Drepanopeziza brunnea f. sp. 'multigermtubi' MB_m1]EKD15141.1 hypothetical protein MBM_06902 [Drepanopeziza brunnea f. sp. 'multigermtubi' MB_m1]